MCQIIPSKLNDKFLILFHLLCPSYYEQSGFGNSYLKSLSLLLK